MIKPRRILLMACSQRKKKGRRNLPAIDRYDGPAFRVLRKYLREVNDRSLSVYVLSAQYGIIPSWKRLPNYDQKMNFERASVLRVLAIKKLKSVLRNSCYD